MTILGIKLTHDAAVALIDNGKLIFSYEMEKLNNFPRYSTFCIGMEEVDLILNEFGYSLSAIDQIVIDGWSAWDPYKMHQRIEEQISHLELRRGAETIQITTNELAGYGHVINGSENILEPRPFDLIDQHFSYTSYQHISSHFAGAYCTSSFARDGENSYVLIWDGGMPPQLFYYTADKNKVDNLGPLFPLTGYVYINFPYAFKPFSSMKFGLEIAGKAMAYMALGKAQPVILEKYRSIFRQLCGMMADIWMDIDVVSIITDRFIKEAKQFGASAGFSDEDMLTTFQEFVQELLLDELTQKVNSHPDFIRNLCIGGGCALNIKWNNSIRESGIFKSVWVPPFPNDAGSAIGTACCEMIVNGGPKHLTWDVYSGPMLNGNEDSGLTSPESGRYSEIPCTLDELANILHELDEPVVFLNGRAELGPRALGNRSILAPAVSPTMKERLNAIKNRETYRPVSPVCLEEYAADIFTPGTADPYMLFEHFVKDSWKKRIPAILHLDGSARLQTINREQNKTVHKLLTAYYKRSGIPVLCNTSANFNGSGFFPDISSAIKWGKANLIWNDGKIYIKNDCVHFQSIMDGNLLSASW